MASCEAWRLPPIRPDHRGPMPAAATDGRTRPFCAALCAEAPRRPQRERLSACAVAAHAARYRVEARRRGDPQRRAALDKTGRRPRWAGLGPACARGRLRTRTRSGRGRRLADRAVHRLGDRTSVQGLPATYARRRPRAARNGLRVGRAADWGAVPGSAGRRGLCPCHPAPAVQEAPLMAAFIKARASRRKRRKRAGSGAARQLPSRISTCRS